MAEALGGKKAELGGHKTTDRRFHGRGNNIAAKVETPAAGGGHIRLNQAFINSAAKSARTAIRSESKPRPIKIAPINVKSGG